MVTSCLVFPLHLIISSTSGYRKLIALVMVFVHTQLAPAEHFSRDKPRPIRSNERCAAPCEISVMFSHVL